jgi:mRNA interferase MazF
LRRGDLYRVFKPSSGVAGDPKIFRVFVVVSRQALLDSNFSTIICAPVFTTGGGLSSQVAVGPDEGLKHPSWIMCDSLVSLRKSELTQFVGSLPTSKIAELNRALTIALNLP